MEKDFDTWNEKKKELHARDSTPFFHTREIWWCSLGANIGFEQDGAGGEFYRPVLVLKGMSRQTFYAIPLTTSVAQHPLRPSVGIVEGQEAHALLSQIRLVDAKRLVRKVCYLDKDVFQGIRKAVKDML